MLSTWTALLLAATAAGAAACTALVARRRPAAMSALATGLLLAVTLYSVGAITEWTRQAGTGFAAAFIGLGAVIGGFFLAAALVPLMTRLPTAPRGRGAGGDGPPAVIVLAEGQPEHYDPAVTTQSFERLAETDVPLPPLAVRVFAYVSDRGRYRRAGISPSRPVVRAVTARAADHLRRGGFEGPIHEAWLHGTPRLCDAAAAAGEDGSRDVAIVLLDVAESYEYDLALRELGRPGCEVAGTVACSPPLWSKDALAHIVCEKVLSALPEGPREGDGVVVVASGQPPEWDRTHPQATEQRTFFCQRVRSLLVERGLADARVRTAWLDWHDPDVTEVVRHLAAVGCDRVVVVPATSVADTLEIAIDLPAAVAGAAVDAGVKVDVLHGWGEEDAVAEVVANAARETLEEMGWSSRTDDQ